MKKSDLEGALAAFSQESPLNYVGESVAIAPEVVGLRMYDAPIVGYGAADDPWFDRLQNEEAVGHQFEKPDFWLPGAKTVISFFAPKSERVREDNAKVMGEPSIYWLHARKEGQDFIDGLCRRIMELLAEQGYRAVAPSLDSRFQTGAVRLNQAGEAYQYPFTSNWSERHVAYVCGMGTFGLSRGLITEKGIAGRFGSVITDWVAEPKPREYTGIYDWCIMCGLCGVNCPADAITIEKGKDHPTCSAYLRSIPERFHPRYGCGKCQVAVPCERTAPGRRVGNRH